MIEYVRHGDGAVPPHSFLFEVSNHPKEETIMKVSKETAIAELKKIVGEDRVITDPEVLKNADVLNRNRIPCLNVFIHAPIDERVARLRERHDITEAEARKFIRKSDKARANYHRKYAFTEWGKARNYHMTISSSLGIDRVVRIIAAAVEK